MPTFPRTKPPRLTTPPQFPEGFSEWGLTGKGQFRAFENAGRIWQEVWPAMDYKTTEIRALIRAINYGLREKIIWDVQHPLLKANYGVGGGSPLVNGASQTGSSIVIDAGPTSITNWLRDGDIIKFSSLQLIYDVTANVNTDSGGNATIPIHPPIFAGQSPPNNDPVGIVPASFYFKAVIVSADMPDIEADGLIQPGLTVVWREQPSS